MLLNLITDWLTRHGWLRKPKTSTELVAWHRIGQHIMDTTEWRRLG